MIIHRRKDFAKNFLFIEHDGSLITQPRFVGGIIKSAFYKYEDIPVNFKQQSTICLAKYAIIQLIDAGIDRDVIKSFTGYVDAVYDSCRKYTDVGLENENKNMVTNTIKTLPIFDVL